MSVREKPGTHRWMNSVARNQVRRALKDQVRRIKKSLPFIDNNNICRIVLETGERGRDEMSYGLPGQLGRNPKFAFNGSIF